MEKLMLQELIISKKIENLQNELHIIRAEMEFFRKFPEETQQKVINEPSLETSESLASPEQTATGKDTANPLMVGNLPKVLTGLQKPLVLGSSSSVILKPNMGIQIPGKTSGNSQVSPHGQNDFIEKSKNFYVVYNGPGKGIYNNWGIANMAIQGVKGVSYRKFKTLQEARISADIYCAEMMTGKLELINGASTLKPMYKQALQKTTNKMFELGAKPNLIITIDEDSGDTIYDSFSYFYTLGREATEKEFVDYKFYTTDKKNMSYFNFYPNANCEVIYEAFVNGLVNIIYPSNNILELSKFPKGFREAVKIFKRNCAKDKSIFIKVQSTIPFWIEDELIKPFHYIQLGIVSNMNYVPSQKMQITLEKDDLKEIAVHKYSQILEKIWGIKEGEGLMINYASNLCFMTSSSTKPVDRDTLYSCKNTLSSCMKTFGMHVPELCKAIKKVVADTFETCHCQNNDKGKVASGVPLLEK